ncbi:ABC transporter permease [Niabella beijingensis]|uniref:ABC transporter permease n=1 Tax=Niabella beijingensis TaxID=2872700 RepID=UPI001CBD0111|nr:ABC transporter permease [Niabella beijingensis]MBZ4188598.1 ABC transporter permease [Niabella beijingensis]
MFRNYLKIAWRNLFRNKAFSVINITGLSIGMAVAMLIGLWIWDEFSFNRQFAHHDRIAQVMQHVTNNGEVRTGNGTPYPVAEALRQEYGSHFKQVVLEAGRWEHTLSAGQKRVFYTGGFYEPGIGELLDLHMIGGNRNGLTDPNALLISETVAAALFGGHNAIGRTVTLDQHSEVKIAGVYRNLPLNSSFGDVGFMGAWRLFVNTSDWMKTIEDPWRPNAFTTYVQLTASTNLQSVSHVIRDLRLRHVNERLAKQRPELFLYPMDRWHLYETFKDGRNDGGRIRYIWLFGIIGVFVLILGCINFMNLSTARSVKRAKEIGVRKTAGSRRYELVLQFFCESFLCVLLSFLLCLVLVGLLLPLFNTISGKQTAIPWSHPVFWISALFFCSLTGLLAGLYPAFYLSSFNPVKVLKGPFQAGRFAGVQRKLLVVVQFTISVVLIIGTLTVFRQIEFARKRPLGYDQNGLVAIEIPAPDLHGHFEVIQSELTNGGLIAAVAEADDLPTQVGATTTGIDWPGKDPNTGSDFPFSGVGYDYGKTVGWQLLEGRDFSRAYPTDSSAVVLNEAAVKFMGLKQPVGTMIQSEGVPMKVIGVIKDMIMESPYAAIRPSLYYLHTTARDYYLLARIRPDANAGNALQQVEKLYKKYLPGDPFHYQFVDAAYDQKFGDEERMGRLGGSLAILAVFVSCLGLFGMASFMVEQRVKEIGVRKVLGASEFGLWELLSKDFVQLMLLSISIAVPVAWYGLHSWLQQYNYHAGIPWWIFCLAGLGAFVVALLTVSYQTIKAVSVNPVKSLRTE